MIVVSPDDRFASVLRFLLDRRRLAVRAARRQPELLTLVEEGVDVVVLDATYSLADTAQAIAELEALHPEIGVVVVSERRGRTGSLLRLLPKWGPPQQLIDEIERTYLHRPPPARARALHERHRQPRPAVSLEAFPVDTPSSGVAFTRPLVP